MKQILLMIVLVGCGHGPATEEVRDNPPEQTDLAGVEAKEFEKTKAEAEKRDSEAQFSLGVMHYDGQGVEQDFKEAVKWYLKSAEQGEAIGQYALGPMYYLGKRVEQDYVTAYAWSNIAAANGSERGKLVKGNTAKKMTPDQITKAEELVKEMVKKNPKLINKK